jgi:hypothetical protein
MGAPISCILAAFASPPEALIPAAYCLSYEPLFAALHLLGTAARARPRLCSSRATLAGDY